MRNFDRLHPALVTIKDRYPLTKESSTKQTWHVTLDLGINELEFHPGDSLGIYPQNDPILVDHLIEAMGANPQTLILHKRSGQEMSLQTFLSKYANLSRITSSFLKVVHEWEPTEAKKKVLNHLLEPQNKLQLKEYLSQKDPLDVLREYGQKKVPLQEICDQFGPLLPRFYSIASSRHLQKGLVDLTVALFSWTHVGEKRYGVASHFLCHLAEIGQTPVPIYVQPAHHFRLPENIHADLIMIGPGTGVAPFRAFMQERMHFQSRGRHWLFFGERNRAHDFFYEDYWQGLVSQKSLRMSTAFSRDQQEKYYVQHKMQEEASELFDWLENGAHLYLCGDAEEMAKDVDKTLQQIIQQKGNLSEEKARDYLLALKKADRFMLDVY